MKNILIINQPLGNRGDESAHRALIRSLCKVKSYNITVLNFITTEKEINSFKEANARYITIRQQHDYRLKIIIKYLMIFRLVTIGTLIHPTLRKLIPIYKNSDYIICAPGGICMGGFQVWWHVYLLLLAKKYNKKLAYYSRSFGPFPTETLNNRIFKQYSLKMLHYFDFLSIRDSKTMKLADELNVSYIPSIDTAFLDSPQVYIPEIITNQIGLSPFVVFVPNSLTWHYMYKHIPQDTIDSFYLKIIDLIHLQYPVYKIVMLPQLCDSRERSDYSYFLKLKEKYTNKESIIIIDDIYSSDIQQCIIKKSQFVIGARYHSIVFAINNKKPFIALSYEHKMDGLLSILNLNNHNINITNTFNSSKLTNNTINDIIEIANKNISSDKLEEANGKAKKIAEETMNHLKRICL